LLSSRPSSRGVVHPVEIFVVAQAELDAHLVEPCRGVRAADSWKLLAHLDVRLRPAWRPFSRSHSCAYLPAVAPTSRRVLRI
jgi:hypothetical protein